MGFTDAGWPEEDDVLVALDEAELVEAVDLFALDRGLEGEVELLDGLDRRQPGLAHCRLYPAVVAKRDLRPEQPFERLAGGDTAPIDFGEDVIDGFQGAGKLQVGQHLADVVASHGAHRTASA